MARVVALKYGLLDNGNWLVLAKSLVGRFLCLEQMHFATQRGFDFS